MHTTEMTAYTSVLVPQLPYVWECREAKGGPWTERGRLPHRYLSDDTERFQKLSRWLVLILYPASAEFGWRMDSHYSSK